MQITVVQKASGSEETIEVGSELQLSAPSVVELRVGPEQVADYQRSGNNLVIMLKDGSSLTIVDFFGGEGTERNEIVLVDEHGVSWWGQYEADWKGFDFAEIDSDPVAAGAFPLAAILGGLAAVGGGIALATSGGDDDDRPNDGTLTVGLGDTSDPTTVPISGTTRNVPPGSEVAITVTDKDGNTVEATATVQPDGSYSVDADLSGLADGPLTVEADATDENGNPVGGDATGELDAVPGELTVDLGDTTDPTHVPISGTSTDLPPGSEVTIIVTDQDGNKVETKATIEPDGSYSTDTDLSGLTDGPLTVEVEGTDNNGNAVGGTDSGDLDVVAGALTVDLGDTTDSTQVPITGTTTDVPVGSTVTLTVTDQDGNEVPATATVQPDGTYAVDTDLTSLTDGPLTVEASGTDHNGSPVSDTDAGVLDAVPSDLTVDLGDTTDPTQVPISGTSSDLPPGSEVTITVTDQDGNEVETTATIEPDGSYSTDTDLTGLTDGPLTVEVEGTDNNGDPVTGTDTGDLDAVPGALTVDLGDLSDPTQVPITGTTNDVPAGSTVTLTVTDQNGNEVPATATVQPDGSYSVDTDLSGLADGPLTVDASSTDNNGDPVADTDTGELDAVPGELTVDLGDTTDSTQVPITGTTSDVPPGSEVTITVTDQDGNEVPATATVQPDGSYSTDTDLTGLTDGPLTVEVEGTDNNGNPVTGTDTGDLDAVPGGLTVDLGDTTDPTQVPITGTTTDVPPGSTVTIAVTDQDGNEVPATATVQPDGSYSTDTDLSGLTDGPLMVEASSADHNGDPVTDTDAGVLDAVPGALTVDLGDTTDPTQVPITGTTTDVPPGSTVTIAVTDQDGNEVPATATVQPDGSYSVDIDLSGLTDGPLTVAASSADYNGDPVTDTDAGVLDAVPGALTVDLGDTTDPTQVPITGTTTDVPPGSTVTIVVTDQNGNEVPATATVQPDGSYSTDTDLSGLTDGPLTVEAGGTDNNGNPVTGTDSDVFDAVPGALTVDLGDPTDPTQVPITGTTTDVPVGSTVNITVTDQNGDEVEATAIVQPDGSYSVDTDLSGLTDGPLTAEAAASDNNGNPVTDTDTGVLDAVPGAVTIDLGDTADPTQVPISGTTTDVPPGSTVTITVTDQDGNEVPATATVQPDGTYTVDTDLTGLVDGPLTAEAEGTDNNGNPVAGTDTGELDAVPSALTVDLGDTTDPTQVPITGTTTDVPPGSTVAITVTDQDGNEVPATATVQPDGSYSVDTDLSGLVDGPLTVEAEATDNNGNPVAGTDAGELDAVPGALTVDLGDTTDPTQVPISGTTTDVPPGSTVTITVTDQNGNEVPATATVQSDGSYSVDTDLSGLTDGPLTVEAEGTDNNGDPVAGTDTGDLDAVSGVLTVDLGDTTDPTQVSITGTTNDVPPGSTVTITVTDQNGNEVPATATVQPDGSYSVDTDLSGLTDGPLSVEAEGTDNNGNPVGGTDTGELDAVSGALTVDLGDTTDPTQVPITGTTNDVPSGATVTITVTDQDGNEVPATATVQPDGSYSVDTDLSGLTDGPLTVEASSADHNGDPVTDTDAGVLDAVPGALTVDLGDTTDPTQVPITGTTNDVPPGSTVTIVVTDQDGNEVPATATVQPDGSYSVDTDLSGLTDGPLTVDAEGIDNNGDPVTGTDTGELDAVPGALTVDLGDTTDPTQVPITGTTTDVPAGSTVTITIRDLVFTATVQPDGSYSTDADLSGLADGPLSASATTTDHNGDPVSDTDNAVLDAVPGALMVDLGDTSNPTQVPITGTTTDVPHGSEVTITITDQDGNEVSVTAFVGFGAGGYPNGTYSVDADLSGLVDGPLTVEAEAIDFNGAPVSDTDTGEIDAVPGTVTVDLGDTTDPTQVPISGTSTDVPPGSTITITVTDQDGNEVPATATVQPDGTYSVDTDLTGLVDGPLTVDAEGTDNNGNPVTDADMGDLDVVPGALTVDLGDTADPTQVPITGTSTDVPAGSTVTITVTDQNGNEVPVTATVQPDGSYTVDADLTSLTDGPLTVDANSTDRNGVAVSDTDTGELDAVPGTLTVDLGDTMSPSQVTISGTTTDVPPGSTVTITVTDQNGDEVPATAAVQPDGSYSVVTDLSSLIDGPLSVDASTTDNNGGPIAGTDTGVLDALFGDLTVDLGDLSNPAQVPVTGTTTDVAPGSTVTISVTDQDGNEVPVTATVQPDGSYAVDADLSGLTDGDLTVEASSTDRNGVAVSDTDTGELDAVPGTLMVFFGDDMLDPAQIWVGGNTTDVPPGSAVTITVTDQNGVEVPVTATVEPDGSYGVYTDLSSLIDGPLIVDASSTDNNGNSVADTDTGVLDAVPGALTVDLGDMSDPAQVPITGTTTDVPPDSTVTITVTDQDGDEIETIATVQPDGSYSVDADLSGLTDGPLTVEAEATDHNGNAVTDTDSYTPPVLVGGDGGGNGDNTITGGDGDDVSLGDRGGLSYSLTPGENYNIAIVFDRSGSMLGSKLAEAKEAFKFVAEQFADHDGVINLTFVDFGSDTSQISFADFSSDPANLATLQAYIDGLAAGGSTFYAPAFDAATDWFATQPTAGFENKTLFTTDGVPSDGVAAPGAFANLEAVSPVHAVGMTGISAAQLEPYATNDDVQIVSQAEDLIVELQKGAGTYQLESVGDDMIDGGAGSDIMFGDSINTDALPWDQDGLPPRPADLPDGSGVDALERFLEARDGVTPSDEDLLNYIRANHESFNVAGDTRGGNDTLIGGEGDDIIYGQGGDDIIRGGTGDDILYGGTGADQFVWQSGDAGHDIVADFVAGEDVIDLSALPDDYQVDMLDDPSGDLLITILNGNGDEFGTITVQDVLASDLADGQDILLPDTGTPAPAPFAAGSDQALTLEAEPLRNPLSDELVHHTDV